MVVRIRRVVWSDAEIRKELDESVLRGAILLDSKFPGWEEQIDLNRLDMSKCHKCILGQLYNDIDLGAEILKLGAVEDNPNFKDPHFFPDLRQLAHLGLGLDYSATAWVNAFVPYSALTAAWINYLIKKDLS